MWKKVFACSASCNGFIIFFFINSIWCFWSSTRHSWKILFMQTFDEVFHSWLDALLLEKEHTTEHFPSKKNQKWESLSALKCGITTILLGQRWNMQFYIACRLDYFIVDRVGFNCWRDIHDLQWGVCLEKGSLKVNTLKA